ncbi:MAG: hypothetical protein WD690_10135 [Vicinamibacterales bacterium]
MEQEEIRITVKDLAKCVAASEARQKKILQDHKYREKGEGRARSLYYSEASKTIVGYHAHRLDPDALATAADVLAEKAGETENWRRAQRFVNNERGLRAYRRFFSVHPSQVLRRPALKWHAHGVTVKARPDLAIREAGDLVLVKLEFGKQMPTPTLCTLLLEGMAAAASAHLPPLGPFRVEVWHVTTGERISRPLISGAGTPLLERACRRVAELWPAIEPPKKVRAA